METRPLPLPTYAAGQVLNHAGRTLGDMDNIWYTLLTLNTAPHFDLTSGDRTPFGATLFNSTFTLAATMGAALSDLAAREPVDVSIDNVALTSPLFGGDTIYPSTTVEKVDHDTGTAVTTLTLHTTALSQKGEHPIEIDWRLVHQDGVGMREIVERRKAGSPKLAPDRTFQPQVIGPAYEDFIVGARHDHATSRTMLADEGVWMSLLAMCQAPWNIDRHWSKAHGLPDVLINDFFVLSCVLGFSVKHATQKAVANLGWKDIRFGHPVLPGDTLRSESEVLDKRLSESREGQGIVHLRTIGANQRAEVVVSYDRRFMVFCRDPETAVAPTVAQ